MHSFISSPSIFFANKMFKEIDLKHFLRAIWEYTYIGNELDLFKTV